MANPFPGMDPYLEDPAFWEDFHRRFITQIADALLEHLPDSYDAHIDERVRLVQADAPSASRLPDVAIDWRGGASAQPLVAEGISAEAAVIEPVTLPMPALEEHRDVWIEVVHLPQRNLVTSIEVLSPSNKTGDDAADYHNKRIELYARHVNLVEIDLLRGGRRLEFAKPLPPGDYYAFVTREQRGPYTDVYSWRLRDPLPVIPVPLLPADGQVDLNLAEVFAAAYERGRYTRRLRYELPLTPPLNDADRRWAAQMVGGAAKP